MQTISFKNIVPQPLKEFIHEGEVWNKEIVFEKGKYYQIAASSGKGKSTILNIIYGLRKDFTGEVYFDQLNNSLVTNNQYSSFRCNTIAYIFQDLKLFPSLSAWDNIYLKPGNKFTRPEIEIWAEKIGVAQLLDKKCGILSYGQQQRIAALRALSQGFDWLLLDEPFSHLDIENSNVLLELFLLRAQQENAGIILSSLNINKSLNQFITITL